MLWCNGAQNAQTEYAICWRSKRRLSSQVQTHNDRPATYNILWVTVNVLEPVFDGRSLRIFAKILEAQFLLSCFFSSILLYSLIRNVVLGIDSVCCRSVLPFVCLMNNDGNKSKQEMRNRETEMEWKKIELCIRIVYKWIKTRFTFGRSDIA